MGFYYRTLLKEFLVYSVNSNKVIGAISLYDVGKAYQLMFHRLKKNQSQGFEKTIWGIRMTDEEEMFDMPSSLDEIDNLFKKYLDRHGVFESCYTMWY